PPYLLFPDEQEQLAHDAVLKDIAELKSLLAAPESATSTPGRAAGAADPANSPSVEDLQKRLREAERRKFSLEQTIYSSAVTETMEPRVTRVLPRGNWMDESGEVVGPGVPGFLGGLWLNGARPTRLDLAE